MTIALRDIEWELARLNTAFAHHLDHRDYDSLVALFTPDAVYQRHGQTLHGHDEIRAAMHQRPDMTIRHLVHNLYLHEVTDQTASGQTYLMAHAGPAAPAPVPYITGQGHLVEVRDRYVRTEQGWRIKERAAETLFIPADPSE